MMRDSSPVALIYDPPFAAAASALKERLGLERMMTLGDLRAGRRVDVRGRA